MIKLLVMSDTHGNHEMLEDALLSHPDAEAIIHLGDYIEDLEPHTQLIAGRPLFLAPGRYDRDYEYGIVPLVRRADFEGWNLILTHERRNVSRSWLNSADIVLYGHTHIPLLEIVESIAWANPGHLKCPLDRGAAASCLLLTLTPGEAVFEYRDENGIAWKEEHLTKPIQ